MDEGEQVANESSGKQQELVCESGVQINQSNGVGLNELEKLLQQKTFTRYGWYDVYVVLLILV